MKDNKKILLLASLSEKTKNEQEELEMLIKKELNWGCIGGILVHYRLFGYFYYGLSELRTYIAIKFIKTLRLVVNAQKMISQKSTICITKTFLL